MNQPLQITFRGMAPSEAVRERIEEYAEKLEQFCDRILTCHVVVEEPHRHHQQGNHFHVRVAMAVPGRNIVVDRAPAKDALFEDPYATLHDAFDAARRKLQQYTRAARHH
ncbi:MAG TPA: HPF/RaiA family ribosome-associated protein [Aggregicoccus sp.]|nr:HPF/RaiA family ribosome-associated protein [Aggregicoccus sp.]